MSGKGKGWLEAPGITGRKGRYWNLEGLKRIVERERQRRRLERLREMALTSIIVLNWNGMNYTKPCIESVLRNTREKFEIIVIDNGSKEPELRELRKMAKGGKIQTLIENGKNVGFARANNQGLRKAKGDYLFLLNNDTLVPKNWLKDIIAVAESGKKVGIVGVNLPAGENDKKVYGGAYVGTSGMVKHWIRQDAKNLGNIEVDQVGGAAMLFKRSVFERIGELDEGFSPIYFEETDFCARARKAGYRVVFAPNISIIHFGSALTRKQPSRWMYVVLKKNRIRYLLIHFPWWKLLLTIPFEAARFVKSIFELRAHWLWEAYWLNLKSLGEIMGKRLRYGKGDVKVTNKWQA